VTVSTSRRLLALIGGLLAVAVVAGGSGYLLRHRTAKTATEIRVSGLPAAVTTDLANLMQLVVLPPLPAPDFAFTDQFGHPIRLSDFRGHAVILEFMDPNCIDICPIVSQELLAASRGLQTTHPAPAFLAINVNPYHLDAASMARFSTTHGLTTLTNWHFLTAALPTLRQAWLSYHVTVSAASPTADVVHSSLAYFIDPNGNERYLATPMVDHNAAGTAYLSSAPLNDWGKGIALVLKSLP
jgi:cytochrome oxidase Cu insertion factor (SCO1/SenC/PrrC family)